MSAKTSKSKNVVVSGKRKTAIARVTVKKGSGNIRINKMPLNVYQPELARLRIMEPIVLAGDDKMKTVDINVIVEGGGFMGQANAIRTAIAKGLVTFLKDGALKQKYLSYDRNLLVNDSRRTEPKHPLGRGARAKFQKSYR
jgi:small subunit ribosomal protein S9